MRIWLKYFLNTYFLRYSLPWAPDFYCFQLGTSAALSLSSLAPGFGLLLVYYTRGSSMKLITKGRGELHKRLLNKACNKPEIAGGRWEKEEGRWVVLHEAPDGPCVLLYTHRTTGDERKVPNPGECMAPTCSTHSSPGEGFPSSLSQGHHQANSARGLMFNKLWTSMALCSYSSCLSS